MVDGVSIPLAFEDAVPVALSAAGLVVLARGVGARTSEATGRAALVAAVVVASGGVAKVSWKLIAAISGRDVTWLDELLFPFLAIGFAGFALSIVAGRRGVDDAARVLAASGGVAVVVLALVMVDPDLGIRTARAIAIVGSLATSALLVRIAMVQQDPLAVGLIAVNVTATLALAGMARIEQQTLALQWIEQSINTASQAGFLLAAWRIARPERAWATAADTPALVS